MQSNKRSSLADWRAGKGRENLKNTILPKEYFSFHFRGDYQTALHTLFTTGIIRFLIFGYLFYHIYTFLSIMVFFSRIQKESDDPICV